jgi:uncharacterized surface protein with fasciclin (FAS1) repeats
MKRKFIAAVAITMTAALAAPATSASAGHGPQGTLADVLLADKAWDDANGFDHVSWDFDIVTQAVLAFEDLTAAASAPDSNLTVFLPTDYAFRKLVKNLTGQWLRTEKEVFDAVVGLGLDTVKKVLTYHILAGAQIDFRTALQSDGAALTMLSGDTLTVDVRGKWRVVLQDNDPDLRDPRVIFPDIRATNGIAHAIDRVLLPINV